MANARKKEREYGMVFQKSELKKLNFEIKIPRKRTEEELRLFECQALTGWESR
jgi:hypothetical protein